MLKLASLSQVSLARGRRAALGLALILLLVWPATPRADEARYEALMESGSAAYQERDYAAAARLWAGAVAEAESFGPTDSRLAASLNSLAKARRSQARYRDSARLTQRALAIWQTTLGPEHPVVALALGDLGLAMRLQGRFADAEPLLQRALDLNEKASAPMTGDTPGDTPGHPDVARGLTNTPTLSGAGLTSITRFRHCAGAMHVLAEFAQRFGYRTFAGCNINRLTLFDIGGRHGNSCLYFRITKSVQCFAHLLCGGWLIFGDLLRCATRILFECLYVRLQDAFFSGQLVFFDNRHATFKAIGIVSPDIYSTNRTL